MRSYKQWQALNESLFPLGLSNPQNVSGIVGRFQYLDEKKKHMHAENPEEDYEDEEEVEDSDDDDDDDEGDDEGGSCGDDDAPAFCHKKMKKGMKKKMKNECDCEDKKGKKPVEADDEDLEDAEEETGIDLDNDDEEGEDEEHAEKVGRPLGFMKKKGMKKKMKKKMKKESVGPDNDFLQSFNSYAAPENQMTSEESWWKSVTGHFANPDQKFSDGFTEYMEDYLIDPQAQQNFVQGNGQQHGPRPGEVGYAPQQRMGWFGNTVTQGETEDPFMSEGNAMLGRDEQGGFGGELQNLGGSEEQQRTVASFGPRMGGYINKLREAIKAAQAEGNVEHANLLSQMLSKAVEGMKSGTVAMSKTPAKLVM